MAEKYYIYIYSFMNQIINSNMKTYSYSSIIINKLLNILKMNNN